MTDSDVNGNHPATDLPTRDDTDVTSLDLPGASDDPTTDDDTSGSDSPDDGTHGRPSDDSDPGHS